MKKLLLCAGLVLIAAYYPIWVWMVDRWLSPTSYYSHGFLIPLMSGYLVWKKNKLIDWDGGGSRWGLFFVFSGLLVLIVSALWKVYFVGAFSFVVVLFGSVFYLLGKNGIKQLWFPLLFLVFMIPIPLVTIANLSLHMKLLAADLAVKIIETSGIMVVQDGSYLYFQNGTMIVGNVCSGLRSLIALLAFGAFFSYLSNLPRGPKIIMFLSSIPIALVANIGRVVALCYLGQWISIEFTGGWVHETSGLLIFVFAFLMLFTEEKIFGIFCRKKGEV